MCRLCEKFSIHGYGEAAARLRLLKDKFMDDAHSIGDSCTSISVCWIEDMAICRINLLTDNKC